MQNEDDDAITLSAGQVRLLELLPPLKERLERRLMETPSGLARLTILRRELPERIAEELAAFDAWKNDLMRVFLGPLAEALESSGTRAAAEQGFAALQAVSLAALERWQSAVRWADDRNAAQDLALLWRTMARRLAQLIDDIVALLEHPENVGMSGMPGRRRAELTFDLDAVAPLISRLADIAEPYSFHTPAPKPRARSSSGLGTLALGLILGWGFNEWLDGD